MNIDRIIESIPTKSKAERQDMRDNARRWLDTGTAEQKAQAAQLIAALDGDEQASRQAQYQRLKDMPLAQRVVEAFRVSPPSDNERKTIQALLANPGATSTELSRAYGHDSMIWQMHFGNMCKDRQAHLWPAEKAEKRDGQFFSGILADYDPLSGGFAMRAELIPAFEELGFDVRRSSAP